MDLNNTSKLDFNNLNPLENTTKVENNNTLENQNILNNPILKNQIIDNTKEIEKVLDNPRKEIPKTELLNILENSIEKVEINDNQIYIKLNKDLILHSNNTIFINDNLNIQIAKQIHLNPVIKFFSKINNLIKG